jgi:hypothetical protein
MATTEPDNISTVTAADAPAPASPPPAEHATAVHDASVWPAVLAGGLTVAFLGLITMTWLIVAIGVVGTVLGIGGWMGELLKGTPHLAEPDLARPHADQPPAERPPAAGLPAEER